MINKENKRGDKKERDKKGGGKKGETGKRMFVIAAVVFLIAALFSISLSYETGAGEEKNYFANLVLIPIKKKYDDFMVKEFTQADVVEIFEDASPEDRVFDQLDSGVEDKEVYFTGCGGGESFLD